MSEAIVIEGPFEELPIAVDAISVPEARTYRVIMVGMVALVSLLAYQTLAVTTAMPTVANALDGLSLYAMAFAAPMATAVIGMVVAGIWCDRRGPAGALLGGVTLFIIGMLLVGFAPAMVVVVLGRAVHGLGVGLFLVALYVVIGRIYPESVRPGVFMAISAAWVVPSIIGPTIAGLTVQYFNWRWVFLSIPILAIPATFLVRPALKMLNQNEHGPEGAWNRRRSFIEIGWSLLAAAGAAALYYGGERRDVIGIAFIVVAIVGLALSGPRLLPQGTFRAHRGLPSVFILRGLICAAFFGAELYLPLFLTQERNFSPAKAGSILTIGGVTWFAGSWARKRFDTRAAPSTFLRIGAISLVIGIASVAALVSSSTPVLVGVLGWGFSGFGMGLTYSTLSLLTLQLSTTAEQGKNSSALQISEALSGAVVLALTGAIFAALHGRSSAAAFLVAFGVSWSLALCAVLLSGRVRGGPVLVHQTSEVALQPAS